MKIRNNHSGYSLIELLAGVLAASVLALTAGTMVFHAYNGWNDNHTAVNLHRDARHAMDMLTRQSRDAHSADMTLATQSNLILQNSDGVTVGRFYQVDRNLIYDPPNGDEMTLIADGVGVFTATPSADTVVIQLQLDRDEENIRLESVVGFRN
jgi:type II secretory pathway pseudopilin PulG